jgi:hypothetical protein
MENSLQTNAVPFWLSIIETCVWPLIVVVFVIYFRKQIKILISRVKQFSFAGIDIEISHASCFSTAGLLSNMNQFGAIANEALLTSFTHSLIDQLETDKKIDYITIDIGNGDKWLTSRLFIISNILARNAGLKCIVFVSSAVCHKHTFQGLIDVDNVHWSIASGLTLYEIEFCRLLSENITIISPKGAIDKENAVRIVRQFITNMQSDDTLGRNNLIVNLEGGTREYAYWLTKENISTLFGSSLDRRSINSNNSKKKRIKKVLRHKSDYVAIVDNDCCFKELINRRKVVEMLIKMDV